MGQPLTITSVGETEAVKKIAGLGLDAEVVALARPLKEDIDRALDCDVPYIHVFISTSDLHIETMMKTTRKDVLKQAVEGVDFVIHQGALPSVPRSVNDPMETHQINATGTLNLLIAARDAKVRRMVYASSSSVYGDSPDLPKHTAMPTAPKSPYAVSKLAGEQYCQAFSEVYGLETVSLRYFNVFGPRQDPASQYAAVIPLFAMALHDPNPPSLKRAQEAYCRHRGRSSSCLQRPQNLQRNDPSYHKGQQCGCAYRSALERHNTC